MASVCIGACPAPLGLKTIIVGVSPARLAGLRNGRAVGARDPDALLQQAEISGLWGVHLPKGNVFTPVEHGAGRIIFMIGESLPSQKIL